MSINKLTHATDPDGREVVGVHLSNRPVTAWLYADDFDRIRAACPNATWSLTSAGPSKTYVRIRGRGRACPSVYVARLIDKAAPRTAVRFKDGNSLNLRRTNLIVVAGGGGCVKRQGRPSFRRDVQGPPTGHLALKSGFIKGTDKGRTLALAKPGSPHVVKVGINPLSDPWPHYAAWCFARPGPFKPRVRSLRWYGQGMSRFFVSTMDRLYMPVSSFNRPPQTERERIIGRKNFDLVVRLNDALHGWYEAGLAEGIDRREWRGLADDARLTTRLAKRFAKAGLNDLAAFTRTLATVFPRYPLDPAPQNWFFRADGRLVMLDPFTRVLADIPETAPRLVKVPRSA